MAIVMNREPDGPIERHLNKDWQWNGVVPHLLALCADSLAWLVWSKTKDGSKNRRRPRPIPRPGVTAEDKRGRFRDTVALPLDELKRRLAAPRSTNQ